ncbi:MAG: hypothetical protein AB7R55_02220 [Gemmatimonadales bacterium]
MRRVWWLAQAVALVIGATLLIVASAVAQSPLSRLRKAKDAVKKAVDTAASKAAADAIDSSRLAKPLTPVAALLGDRPGCAGDSTAVGATVVTAAKRELQLGDTTLLAQPGSPCPNGTATGAGSGAAERARVAPQVGGGAGTDAASAVSAALVAAPLVAGGAKRLFGSKPPSASDVLKTLLQKGRVEVRGMRFLPGSDRMEPVPLPLVEPVAEALAALDGRVGIHVCLEANPRGAMADTALTRRRLERVWATLLSVGASDRAFAPLAETRLDLLAESKAAKLGESEVELILLPEVKP